MLSDCWYHQAPVWKPVDQDGGVNEGPSAGGGGFLTLVLSEINLTPAAKAIIAARWAFCLS